MCQKSALGDLPSLASPPSLSGAMAAPLVLPSIIRAKRAEWIVIDVREANEDRADAAGIADRNIPLGTLLRDAKDGKLDDLKEKQVACICNIGYRSGVAANELKQGGFNAFTVQRGIAGWKNPAAQSPSLVVTLKSSEPEKIALALASATASQVSGRPATLLLMSDGVSCFRTEDAKSKPDHTPLTGPLLKDVALPAYKKPSELLPKFLEAGGVVLGCTTCVTSRGLEFGVSLRTEVHKGQMPDYLRMVEEATSSIEWA